MSIKVSIYRNPWGDGLNITFWEDRGGRIFVAEPMQLNFKEVPEGYTDSPTLRLSGFYAPAFLGALAEALDEQGVKTDKDAKIQGTLEATKYHLEDLRKLLKLNKEQKP